MSPELVNALFVLLLFIVSLLYSSVGHGGGSGYIALMTLWGIEVATIRSSVLVLNAFVSLIAFIHYQRQGHFRWKLFYPFIITSIPMAYFGSLLQIDSSVYKKILGLLLLFSVIRLIGFGKGERTEAGKLNIAAALVAGGAIGFLSGLIGIGGGIILTPLMLLMGWAGMKQTAAVSALFIFVNSLAGIGGIVSNHQFVVSQPILLWIFVGLAGAFAGGYWGSRFAATKQLGYVLSVVLVIASFKLLFY